MNYSVLSIIEYGAGLAWGIMDESSIVLRGGEWQVRPAATSVVDDPAEHTVSVAAGNSGCDRLDWSENSTLSL